MLCPSRIASPRQKSERVAAFVKGIDSSGAGHAESPCQPRVGCLHRGAYRKNIVGKGCGRSSVEFSDDIEPLVFQRLVSVARIGQGNLIRSLLAYFLSQQSPYWLSLPNPRHTYEALKSLGLDVVGESYLTPSAALADYVFPICSTVETTELG